MATTTIRLEDDLKARVALLAQREGKTAHAFMVEAIARTVERAERDDAFHDLADARWAAMEESVPWEEAKAWLEARSRGEAAPRPAARKIKG